MGFTGFRGFLDLMGFADLQVFWVSLPHIRQGASYVWRFMFQLLRWCGCRTSWNTSRSAATYRSTATQSHIRRRSTTGRSRTVRQSAQVKANEPNSFLIPQTPKSTQSLDRKARGIGSWKRPTANRLVPHCP